MLKNPTSPAVSGIQNNDDLLSWTKILLTEILYKNIFTLTIATVLDCSFMEILDLVKPNEFTYIF